MKELAILFFVCITHVTYAQGYSYFLDSNNVRIYVKSNRLAEFCSEIWGSDDVFIKKAIKYPQSELANLRQGNVGVTFIVNDKGQVTNPKVISGISAEFDKEAIRVISTLPDFRPAKMRGEVVSSVLYRQVKFLHPQANEKEIVILPAKAIPPTYQLIEDTVKEVHVLHDDELLPPVEEEVRLLHFAEVMPEFPYGDKALIDTITQNLVYPEQERKDGITGKVMIRFIVDEKGNVIEPTVMRGISPGLDKEALRIVSTLPRFKPGRQQGKPVKVYYTLPVVFKL